MGPRPRGLEPHPEGQGVPLFTEEQQARSGCWLIMNSAWVEVGEPEGGLGAPGWWLLQQCRWPDWEGVWRIGDRLVARGLLHAQQKEQNAECVGWDGGRGT